MSKMISLTVPKSRRLNYPKYMSLAPASDRLFRAQMAERLRTNMYKATCPRLNKSKTTITKFPIFAWEIPHLAAETAAYEWIDSHKIAPKSLGHLFEEGRIIGFLIERITDARHVTREDISACQVVLSKLHTRFGY